MLCFFCNATPTTEIYTYCHPISLHDALPICWRRRAMPSTPTRRQPERAMTAGTNPTQPFADRLDAAAKSLPGGGRPWLDRLRSEARAVYRETGLPEIGSAHV